MNTFIELPPKNPINYLTTDQLSNLVRSSSIFTIIHKHGKYYVKEKYVKVYTEIARKIKKYHGSDLEKNWGHFEKLIANTK